MNKHPAFRKNEAKKLTQFGQIKKAEFQYNWRYTDTHLTACFTGQSG